MSKNVIFLVNKSEITAGTRGSSLGPDAIITAARNKGSFLFGANTVRELKNFNHLLDAPTKYQYAKRLDGLLKVYFELNQEVSKILTEGSFPFILAGDHGSAGGTIAGIKSAYPTSRLGVVWIDAHADIHTPYTTPSGNIHGMPLASALAIDNLECKLNDLDAPTISLWNELKNFGSCAPKIKPEDIVYIGLRDVEKEEQCILDQLKIKNIPVSDVRNHGVDVITSVVNEQLKNCDIIYVSFDVDSMDPILTSHGTGTPVKNGISPEEATALLLNLTKNPKTVCIEVVEVNPCLDEKKNTMAEVALSIIEKITNTIKTDRETNHQ